MGSQLTQQAYAQSVGTTPTNYPWIDTRDPLPIDIYYPIGKFWINTPAKRVWYLDSQSNISGSLLSNWQLLAAGSGISQFTTDDSLVEIPSGLPPNIFVHGTNGLTTSRGASDKIDINLPPSTQGQVLAGNGVNNPSFTTTVLGQGTFNFTDATPGDTRILAVTNADNTNTSSNSQLLILTGGSSSGNPAVHWAITGVTDWIEGINNADTDSFELCQGTTFGTNVIQRVDRNLLYTNYPSQPVIFAYLDAPTTNSTGDGTAFTVPFNSTSAPTGIDQRSNFNTGTGAFTAPITGYYKIDAMVDSQNVGAGHTLGNLSIVIRNTVPSTVATYQACYANPANNVDANGNYSLTISAIVPMTINFTAGIVLTISNSTKTVGVYGQGGSAPGSWVTISMIA